MAEYFLAKSESYKRSTDPTIFRRREIVCAHLNEKYKVTKFQDDRIFRQVKKEAAAEGIEVSTFTFQADKVFLRTAFLYLTGGESEKAKILEQLKRVPHGGAGVKCLVQDGIHTWTDLQKPSVQELSAPPLPVPVTPAGQRLKGILESAISEFERVLEENDALRQENEELTRQLAMAAEANQDYITLLEEENQSLEERLRQAKESVRLAQATTLDRIAEENPDLPQLTVLAQQLRERKAPGGEFQELLAQLPTTFNWLQESGKIVYKDRFLKELAKVNREERGQMVKQLHNLATQGSEYAALHTRKSWMRLPFSPPECLVSRGADDLRFTWKKNSDVEIFWLYRKGDARVRQSES